MKKAKLNLDKNSSKLMRRDILLQGIYYGLCIVMIVLSLTYPHVQSEKLKEFFLFLMLNLCLGITLGGIPLVIYHFFISLCALPTEHGKKRTLWILWTILSPILGFVLFWCSCGLFAVTTGI